VAGPDGRAGEIPIAAVVLKEGGSATEAELINWCKARSVERRPPPPSNSAQDSFHGVQWVGKVVRQPLRDVLRGREHPSSADSDLYRRSR